MEHDIDEMGNELNNRKAENGSEKNEKKKGIGKNNIINEAKRKKKIINDIKDINDNKKKMKKLK